MDSIFYACTKPRTANYFELRYPSSALPRSFRGLTFGINRRVSYRQMQLVPFNWLRKQRRKKKAKRRTQLQQKRRQESTELGELRGSGCLSACFRLFCRRFLRRRKTNLHQRQDGNGPQWFDYRRWILFPFSSSSVVSGVVSSAIAKAVAVVCARVVSHFENPGLASLHVLLWLCTLTSSSLTSQWDAIHPHRGRNAGNREPVGLCGSMCVSSGCLHTHFRAASDL